MAIYVLVSLNFKNKSYCVSNDYINVLRNNGIIPIMTSFDVSFKEYMPIISGILLTGGGDLGHFLINEEISVKAKDISDKRDLFEKEAVLGGIEHKIPILGICRGMQVLSTALGAKLNQHIENHIQKEERNITTHSIKINRESLLYDILKKEEINVNSFHHQCVYDVGDKLRVSAVSEDNIIEGGEYFDKNYFCMGVQWHPESLRDNDSDKIFCYFCEECKKYKLEI